MADMTEWKRKTANVTSLHLDARNPRLRRADTGRSPRDLIQYLFDHHDAMGIAQKIATLGYFPTEPLLIVEEQGNDVVVEGNRRLAALKGLREPALLRDAHRRHLERLVAKLPGTEFFRRVPVVVAPSRRATDRLLVGRHQTTPVKNWDPENRASFILEKLEDGYTPEELEDELGFSLADIGEAKRIRAIADMTASLDLEDALRSKLEAPRTNVFTTIQRVMDSASGRQFLGVAPDNEHGFIMASTKEAFSAALRRLTEDLLLKRQDSRTLNTAENIRNYFDAWNQGTALPRGKPFLPHDIMKGRASSSPVHQSPIARPARSAPIDKRVVPRSFRIGDAPEKLKLIRGELVKMDRFKSSNSGAVMLRVFFELAVSHHLERIGRLGTLKAELKAAGSLRYDTPTLGQMLEPLRAVVKSGLTGKERDLALRALSRDRKSPFTLAELNQFIHDPHDLPTAQDIQQFWIRIEPLMRILLGAARRSS